MLEVGAFEAKNTLGALLDRVEAGEEVRITRHGRPVARLVPDVKPDIARAQEAARRIRERAKENKLGAFNWDEWKAYRDEGRR
ncbi:type II toxin-antitoxin system Phd/YefM family antitoxin [Terracidiphilus gabretensis]|uniref:type II toxin-antitoxin system Phd/YefM family antitoxin n=1 Tax=Terracidiphilus gabretensis TaxID=1577687 RepID=UPI00071B40D3|nr:type II toxin-antitoxin system prevent-host-death family antitoxin [Terracidiphilus gabretensis]